MISKYHLWLQIKNSLGTKFPKNRKIVVFLVDDYGNVRLDSKASFEKLNEKGYINKHNRFDLYDTLETRADLEGLFEVLSGVRDLYDKPAVFTPMALTANIDFATIRANKYDQYCYEPVARTFARKAEEDPKSYKGTWELLQDGISSGIFVPQFHGREHLNVTFFNHLLSLQNQELYTYLETNSFLDGFKREVCGRVSPVAAFDREKAEEQWLHEEILAEGLVLFKQAYGYAPILFTSPGAYSYSALEPCLAKAGIKAVDTYFTGKEHLGNGHYQRKWHIYGQRNQYGQVYLLRNVVFEPTFQSDENKEVAKAIKEIEIAFQWNKPAIISTHRVNFCGHIDPSNRKRGLSALKLLLKHMLKKWPDIEFWSGVRLSDSLLNDGDTN